jgi:IS4 transposase
LDRDGHLPSYAVITPGKVHEIRIARQMKLPRGAMVVFDRGFKDYAWFGELTEQGVLFVTRMKDNADSVVVERRPVSEAERAAGVRADEIVVFCQQATADNRRFFRWVRSWDAEQQRELVFLTNHSTLAPSVVAAVYRERWQVELFFKALKQNLRVKTFVGTSAHALKIQIWTALLAILVVEFLQLRSRFGWSLSRLVALLRQKLFVYRDLWKWLDEPFEPPPQPIAGLPTQLVIQW